MDNFTDLFFYLDSEIGILYFACIYIIAILLILPASWLSLLAGFLYGPLLGSIIVFFSAFLGASFSFLLSKRFLSKRIQTFISKYSKLSLLEKIIKKGGLKLIILSRLSPIFPFSVLNYFYGLNKVSYKDFSISLFFILPGSYLYCSLGSLANNLNELRNLKLNNNILINIFSIISSSLIVYFLAKYSNQILKESGSD